jgi:AcrR family transcriptional regulator
MTDTDKNPPLRDPGSTRARILDAALSTFSRKGYHDTRLDDIVDESETSKGAIYFHFANKERLFLALVDQFADLLERRVLEAIDGKAEGMARVQIALETVLDTFGRYRRPAKILLVQAVGLGNVFESKRTEVTDRFARLIEGYLKEAVVLGDIDDVDSEVVAFAWMGAIYGIVIRWVTSGEPEPSRIMNSLVPLLLRSVGYESVPSEITQ